MATEVETLMVTLQASVDQYEKNLAKASSNTDKYLAAIEARGRKLEKQLSASTAAGAGGFDAVSKSLKGTSVQVGNVAAQLNDIGVSFAGGQSPLLVALQQGSQVTQAFGNAGLKGAVMGVGSAFASLLSPVSLATIGLIAAGGYAIQYFGNLIAEGGKSNQTLEEQARIIDAVAKEWGNALPEVKAYNDELQRGKDLADRAAAIDILRAARLENVNAILEQLELNTGDWLDRLRDAGADTVVIDDVQRKLQEAATKLRDGRSATDELGGAMKTLKGSITDETNPALVAIIGLLQQLQTAATNAGVALAKVQPDVASMTTDKIKGSSSGWVDESGVFHRPSEYVPTNPGVPGDKPSLLDYDPNAPATASGGSKSDPFGDATRSMQERTDALRAQADAQAKLNPLVNDFGYAVEFAKARQELLTAAQKGNREITPQLAADIDRLAAAYANTSDEIQKMAEAGKQAAEAVEFQKSVIVGAFTDIRDALEDGKITWEEWGNVVNNVITKVSDRFISMLVDSMFSGGGLPFLNQLIGGATSTTSGSYFPPAPKAPVSAAATALSARSMPPAGLAAMARSEAGSNIQIINNSSATVRHEETAAPGGGRQQTFVIEEAVANALSRPGSAAGRAMKGTFGASQRLIKR